MFKYFRLTAIIMLLAASLLSLSGCSSCKNEAGTGYRVVDESGVETYFTAAPERILTMGMGSDGIVLGLVPPERLVSISALADDPCSSNIVELAKKVKRKHRYLSAEQAMALQPDVVFAYDWTKQEQINTMRDLGIKVIVLKGPRTINDIKRNITTISAALNEQKKGAKLITSMDMELDKLSTKLQERGNAPKRRVLLLSLMQTYGGKGCLYDDLCNRAGVINCLSEAGLSNGQALTKEMIVKINPELIIMPVYNDHNTFDINKHNEEFLNDPALVDVDAIKHGRLFYPREGYIYNCSQDAVFGAVEIARAAYGEDFAQDGSRHLSVVDE